VELAKQNVPEVLTTTQLDYNHFNPWGTYDHVDF